MPLTTILLYPPVFQEKNLYNVTWQDFMEPLPINRYLQINNSWDKDTKLESAAYYQWTGVFIRYGFCITLSANHPNSDHISKHSIQFTQPFVHSNGLN